MQIKAVIFDMDGVLIDSEFLWRRAIVKVFNNIDVLLTIEMCKVTMGLRIDEVVDYWELKYSIKKIKKEKIVANILQELINLVKTEGKIIEGVDSIIALFASQKIPMAIASSSPTAVINAVLKKTLIKDKMTVIHSAENEPYGKPHPSVYITTAKKLGVLPNQCLAFEDSLNGVFCKNGRNEMCCSSTSFIR